tara:strand:- start:188 stop:691 length:504 start_codon:yes stop_codon:yes gene_type:complete
MIIPIKNKTFGVKFMEIDDEDWDKIKHLNIIQNNTSTKHTTYCKAIIYENCKYIKTINIHREIMGLGDYKNDKRVINHIDGNGLNNKKENLEICSTMYNSQSINRHRGNIGIIYKEENTEKVKRLKKWKFCMKVNKKSHSKRFLTEQEAIDYKEEFVNNLRNESKSY